MLAFELGLTYSSSVPAYTVARNINVSIRQRVNKSIGPNMPISASTTPKKKSRTIITPEATAIFVFVWEPRESMNEGQPPQYSLSLLFKRSTDISMLRKTAKQAAQDKFGAGANRVKDPFRSVDDMTNPIEGFRGGVFITAKSKIKPGIVDADREQILDPMDFYPGCICRASVVPFAFDKKGSKGVTFLLNNIQKIKDGTRLDGRKKAEDEFDAVDNDGDDPFEE